MTTFSTSRHYALPPAALYAAIADGARLARWWGPAGFSNRFERFEFRSGGAWTFTMIGPDGKPYPNESEFGAIEVDRMVVVRHLNQPRFQLTITLEPAAGGGTLLRWDQAFEDDAVAASMRAICEPANEQNLDRLAEELRADGPGAAT
ncbi:MAG: SRPBCC domain-containing protein [Burkholderiales bacterium]|nr:SRPBCC domain-containing protein [Burkholderiales bacterium]MDE1928038.1 SRPBCC domain-containing protein [Burkholderiales bacterium]MDE2161181.1 SRPBCC domain-containing protein [Burkholderiales bacterium]